MSLRYDPSLVAQVGGRARQAMQRPVVLPRSDPPSRMTTHGECRGASPFARSLRVSLSAWAIRARYPSGLTVSTKYPVTLVLQVLSPDGTLRVNSIRRAAQWRCYSTGAPGRPAAPQTALTPSFICQEGCRFLPSAWRRESFLRWASLPVPGCLLRRAASPTELSTEPPLLERPWQLPSSRIRTPELTLAESSNVTSTVRSSSGGSAGPHQDRRRLGRDHRPSRACVDQRPSGG